MSSNRIKIKISLDGTLTAIYSDALVPLLSQGIAKIRRASHVEPSTDGSGWTADMSPVDGPKFGPFTTRQAALNAEVDYLESILF